MTSNEAPFSKSNSCRELLVSRPLVYEEKLDATSSSAEAIMSSTLIDCPMSLRPSTSPTSSQARSSRSMSFLVCEADRQNRTREVINGVALTVSEQLKENNRFNSRVGNNNNNNRCLVRSNALQHHVTESGHLGRREEQQGDDRRIPVTVDHETELPQSRRQVSRVESQSPQSLSSLRPIQQLRRERHPSGQERSGCRSVSSGSGSDRSSVVVVLAGESERGCNTHDAAHRSDDLSENGRSDTFSISETVSSNTQSVNELLASCDVSTGGTERFGKRSHENVNFPRVNAKVIANTSSVGSDGTDRMGLVDVEVELSG
jgi:hypothetical protein